LPNLSFTACHGDLTAVSEALTKFRLRRKKPLSNLGTATKWPLKKEEIVDLMGRIERHKSTIALAMGADNLYIAYPRPVTSWWTVVLTCILVKYRYPH